jgi:predicted dehydrogenase
MSEPIRFGAIGCGDIVERSFIPSLRHVDGAELIAATRQDHSKVGAFCKAHAIDRPYRSAAELMQDPDVDVIYVATPVGSHAEYVAAAAEHGKHVLCEKPFGKNLAEARLAAEACGAHGVRLFVAYYRRGFPEVVKIREWLQRGLFGERITIRLHNGSWYMPAIDEPGAWRIDARLGGGGVLIDIGSHRLDLVCHLFGLPARVMCRTGKAGRDDWSVEATATVLGEFDAGDEAQVTLSWAQQRDTDQLWLYGTDASVYCPHLGRGRLILRTDGGEETIDTGATPKALTHVPVIAGVVSGLLDGRPGAFGIEETLPTQSLIDSSYRSARESRWVDVLETPERPGTRW